MAVLPSANVNDPVPTGTPATGAASTGKSKSVAVVVLAARRARQAIADGQPRVAVGNRFDRDGVGVRGVERAQVRVEVVGVARGVGGRRDPEAGEIGGPRERARQHGDALVAPEVLHAEINQLADRDEAVAVLARTVARPADFGGAWIHAPAGVAAYAHDLYANLRALDAANADAILIEAAPWGDAWAAVRDRLMRATRGEDDDRD